MVVGLIGQVELLFLIIIVILQMVAPIRSFLCLQKLLLTLVTTSL